MSSHANNAHETKFMIFTLKNVLTVLQINHFTRMENANLVHLIPFGIKTNLYVPFVQ